MDETFYAELARLLPAVKVLVVTGMGNAFSVGGDPAMVQRMMDDPGTAIHLMKEMVATTSSMLDCGMPIISAINGDVIGAGLPIALMADVSVIAEEPLLTKGHALIGLPRRQSRGDDSGRIWGGRRVPKTRTPLL